MIIYKDVLPKLKAAGYNTTVLMRDRLISQATLDAIRHNRPIALKSLDVICKLTGLQPGDLIAYVEDPADE